MPVFTLDEHLHFPDAALADEDGLIAVGGDLSVHRLLAAYTSGIFPWFTENGIPFWFAPDPRCVLYPHKLHISKSMKQLFNQNKFKVTFDADFENVIKNCAATPRRTDSHTWITPDMQQAYMQLHKEGYAHSVEVWHNADLAGGLYGVSLGTCFFGESMFAKQSNASKYGFIFLVNTLKEKNFTLIDCQVHTKHLENLGAELIAGKDFLLQLKLSLRAETLKGSWQYI